MCVIGEAGKGTFIERLPVSGAASFYVLRPIVNVRPAATAAVSLPLSVSLAAALIPHPLFPRSSLFEPAWPSTPPATADVRQERLTALLVPTSFSTRPPRSLASASQPRDSGWLLAFASVPMR